MKVGTWNVNGIRARATQLAEWVDAEAPDVVCLQEIKASPEQVPPLLCELPGYWCYWHGHKGYSGVGLHVKRSFAPERPAFEHPEFDLETRIVTATLGDTLFASIYVPNGNKDFPAKLAFLQAMERWIDAQHASGRRLVLCGDLNVAREERDVHPKERRANAIGQLPVERALFESMLARGLVDVGRALDPENPGLFTWWAPWRNMRQRNIGWRLDYVLASEPLARRAASSTVQSAVGTSDHAPVVVTFS